MRSPLLFIVFVAFVVHTEVAYGTLMRLQWYRPRVDACIRSESPGADVFIPTLPDPRPLR